MEPVFRQTGRRAAPGPTWGAVLVAVLFGTVLAVVAVLPGLLVASVANLLPGSRITSEISPGPGWPWPIHSWWAALADVAPMAGTATVMALLVRRELRRTTGGGMRLVPVVATAVGVGWLPVPRPVGLVDVPFPVAFLTVVVVARLCWTRMPFVPPGLESASRRIRTRSRQPPPGAVVLAVALVGVSVSYHVLHPLRIEVEGRSGGRSVTLKVTNDGPGTAGLRWVRAPDATGARLLRVEVAHPELGAGDSGRARASIVLRNCPPRFAVTVTRLSVRVQTRWATRTQRVRLERALRLEC
jgi:hypothetical protein